MHIVKSQNIKGVSWLNRIELGSVQFGLNYGVNNGVKVTQEEAKRIHSLLYNNGSNLIDTAPSYGDSEAVISNIIEVDSRVITKSTPLSKSNPEDIIKDLDRSIKTFGPNLYGLMVHDVNDIFDLRFKPVIDYLESVRSGTIKIGVSLYDPIDIFRIYEVFDIDMIQIPFNILDQRACDTNIVKFIQDNKIEVHVRSVFLQGLLLMRGNIPSSLKEITPFLEAVSVLAKNIGLTEYELCLLYVFKQVWVDKIIIGLDSEAQSKDLIDTVNRLSETEVDCDFSSLSCSDINLINPAKWIHDN